MKIVAFAGGVGGAKLSDGLAQLVDPNDLTIIVNTGDDFVYLGLNISPDLDTVCYTLAGLSNPQTGWGLAGDTFRVFEQIQQLGGPAWFHIGDQDLATHIERTRRLKEGQTLSQLTRDFCTLWGIKHSILPMTNQSVSTIVITTGNVELPFQEYFVHLDCRPVVKGFRFDGIERAVPLPGVLAAIDNSDCIILCPSNPWVSIDPILALPGIRFSLKSKPVIAVSPIINGHSLKGPAAKMFSEMGIHPSASAVVHHYEKILSGFVMDASDLDKPIDLKIPLLSTQTIMKNPDDRRHLAADVLNLINNL
jgi:LPPG:FO 2-phospho-L-lactate transferase